MKKLLALSLALALTLSLMACGKKDEPSNPGSNDSNDPSTSAPEYTIRYSHGNSEGSLVYMVAEYFADTLEEKTNGRIKVDVYPSGQLSSGDDEAMTNLMSGAYEMSPAAPSALAKYSNMPEYNILDFPYMFDGVDESQKVIQSDMWKDLDAKFEKTTCVRPRVWYSTGSNAVGNSKHAITTPDDFKSLKLRSAQSDYFVKTLSAMGASPIAMAFGETFSAVQQGTVDGIMTPFVNFWKEGFYEVTKYVTQLQSSEFYHCLMVTSDFYNSLPDDLKAQFDETVAMTQEYSIDLGKQFENEIVPQNLKDLNIELVQLTPQQKAVFAEATAPVREELKDTVGTDFYNSVVDMLG